MLANSRKAAISLLFITQRSVKTWIIFGAVMIKYQAKRIFSFFLGKIFYHIIFQFKKKLPANHFNFFRIRFVSILVILEHLRIFRDISKNLFLVQDQCVLDVLDPTYIHAPFDLGIYLC